MKQVAQSPKTGAITVMEVPPPRLRPGGVLVRTHASLISAGTERTKLELGEKSLLGKARARPDLLQQVVQKARSDGLAQTYRAVTTRLDTPSPLGYSAAGEVVAVAPDCLGLRIGDLVACGGGLYANHAEVDFVPRHLTAKLPAGIEPWQGAYATVGAVALHGVRQAEVGLGDRVVVIGLGLVGLLALQLVRVAGARAVGLDPQPAACDLARQLGAARALDPGGAAESVVSAFTDGVGADAVLVCASTPSAAPLKLAGELVRDRGRVVVVGAVGTAFPRELYYRKEIELRLSRSYGPGRYDPAYEEHGNDYPIGYVRWTEQRNMAEFLRLLADGLVDVAALTTHRFPIDRSAEAYAVVTGKADAGTRPVGVVLDYPNHEAHAVAASALPRPAPSRRTGRLGIGVIGAGSFASRILLPELARDDDVDLVGVSTAGGLSARAAAERFGFDFAVDDPDELIAHPAVDALVIATRHETHAQLAASAIGAGKAVFCEKPLATTDEDLEAVAEAYAAGPRPLVVGFNRRFSPLVAELRDWLPEGVPRAILYRVNAGPAAHEHWTHDPLVGGGRVVGELCHFLDLACHLAEGRPVRVSAEPLGTADDSILVSVAFACGSVAAVQYLADGDRRVPKERLEVFCGGVGTIDDFRSLELARGGASRRVSGRGRRKGHREELRAFAAAAREGVDAEKLALDAFWSSALTLRVRDAAASGLPVAVELPAVLGGAAATSPRG